VLNTRRHARKLNAAPVLWRGDPIEEGVPIPFSIHKAWYWQGYLRRLDPPAGKQEAERPQQRLVFSAARWAFLCEPIAITVDKECLSRSPQPKLKMSAAL